jgi:adenine-specific DNA glycosylase
MSTPEQVNFVYRYQAKKTSRYGILVTYLKDEDAELTIRERILNPLVAFWLPFAFQEYSNASPEEIQQLARSSIYQLRLHIRYLEDTFGLREPPIYGTPAKSPRVTPSDRPNGWHSQEDLEERADDFSEEDDILSQII